MTTLAISTDAVDDIGDGEAVDIESVYEEAMTRISFISQTWAQACRETLALIPQPTAAPTADSGPASQAA